MSDWDTRQSPRARVPPRVWFAECQGSGTRQTFKSLPSASTLALDKVTALLTFASSFAECFGLNTRQSGEFFFFLFRFSLFFHTNTTEIYVIAEVITGSYSPSHMIDNDENDIDTNNTVHHIYHKSNT